MIPWWWLIPAMSCGVLFGMFVVGLCAGAAKADSLMDLRRKLSEFKSEELYRGWEVRMRILGHEELRRMTDR